MYFENGTLNPASTTLADDLRQALIDGLTNAITAGYTNWAIEDHDYVNGTVTTSTITNTAGFASVLQNQTGTTNSRLDLITFLGTDWNTSTKTLNNIAFGINNQTRTPDANGHSGVNHTIPSTMPSLTSGTTTPVTMRALYRLTATSSQTDWSIHVEDTYLYFTFADGTTRKGQWLFIGEYNSLITNPSLTDDEPFILTVSEARNLSSETSGVAVLKSMVPSVAATQNGATFSFIGTGGAAAAATYDRYAADPTTATTSKIYFSRSPSPRVNSTIDSENVNSVPDNANLYGYLRGELPDAYFSWHNNASWGDTVQIDGEVYIYGGGTWYHQGWLNNDRTQTAWIKIEV